MNCEVFQDLITDYLDGGVSTGVAGAFQAHRLGCSDCREMLDDVSAALGSVRGLSEVEPPLQLLSRALVIPTLNAPLTCERVESLVTEFLDGYLEPATYHALEDHFGACDGCSDTLAGVVLAVAACHSVHFNETVEVPDSVIHRVLAETTGTGVLAERGTRGGRWAWFQKAFGLGMRPVAAQRFATAALMVVSSYGVLAANGRSLDPSVIYADAARFSTRIYSRSTELASQTGDVLAEVGRLKSRVDDLFDDGTDAPAGEGSPAAAPRPQGSVGRTSGSSVG